MGIFDERKRKALTIRDKIRVRKYLDKKERETFQRRQTLLGRLWMKAEPKLDLMIKNDMLYAGEKIIGCITCLHNKYTAAILCDDQRIKMSHEGIDDGFEFKSEAEQMLITMAVEARMDGDLTL